MKCCSNCIDDRYLRTEVIPAGSNGIGTCSYCGSEEQKLIDPIKLKDYFDLLLSIYVVDENGSSIIGLLKKDWLLFNNGSLSDAEAQLLLGDIINDGNIARRLFISSSICESNSLAQWGEFRKELMHGNRFFTQMDIPHDRLEELLELLVLDQDDIPRKMYRARLQASSVPYPMEEMGAPPTLLARHGRANPAGIQCLYLASDPRTTISEIRPHTGEKASVAEFVLTENLVLIDLRNPRMSVSPFMLAYRESVASLEGDINFLDHLGDELTRPVLPSVAAIDYVPSQYLCEFAKKCGYQGVVYRSSVGDGLNIALFDPSQAKIKSVSEYYVEKVSVEIRNI